MQVFSVTPFKIDRNKNQSRSTDEVQNLRKERRYLCKDPHQDSGHNKCFFCKTCGDAYSPDLCIIADGAHNTSPRSIASALNSHFASIGKILADKIRPVAPVSMSVANHSGSFQLKETSEAVVLKQLQSLKTNKAIGLDNISARLLKCGAQSISHSITKLFNLSIRSGKFPGIWKCSKVSALFKSGDRTNATNYRPISILPTLSKILESGPLPVARISEFNQSALKQSVWFSLETFNSHCIV